jgi:hypothetical protein
MLTQLDFSIRACEIELHESSWHKFIPLHENDYINKYKDLLAYFIDFESEVVYKGTAQFKKNGLIHEAYATTICEKYGLINKPTDITIKTISDYSEDFLAGSDVSSLFRITPCRPFDCFSYSIGEYIEYNLDKELDVGGPVKYSFVLIFSDDAPICVGGEQQFEITIEMSDGKVFVQKTPVLIFNI